MQVELSRFTSAGLCEESRPYLLYHSHDILGEPPETRALLRLSDGEAVKELDEMDIRPSQYNPGNEIPEKNIAYRLAKKFWFNDYGAYSKHFQADQWIDTRTENPQKPE